MTIKLTILKTGETLISEMQELVAKGQEDIQGMPNAYLLKDPHVVKTKDKDFLTEDEKERKQYGIDVFMTPWIILSKDKDIIVPPDCVMTIVEPIESIKQMFIDKTDTKIDEESND
tara:strand:- start:831 stop:1178 length:348 start_codon:yes stop_codon:yes gene_type:complete